MCAALVRRAASGVAVKVPDQRVPLAWAARWPGWRPDASFIASTASSARLMAEAYCSSRGVGTGPGKRRALRGERPCCLTLAAVIRPPPLWLSRARKGPESPVLRGVLPVLVGFREDHPAYGTEPHEHERGADDRQPLDRARAADRLGDRTNHQQGGHPRLDRPGPVEPGGQAQHAERERERHEVKRHDDAGRVEQ